MDLKKVERVYTSYAGVYDHIFGKVFHEGRESAIRNLNVQPDEKILEVGIGTGLALPMYPRHCQIAGIHPMQLHVAHPVFGRALPRLFQHPF